MSNNIPQNIPIKTEKPVEISHQHKGEKLVETKLLPVIGENPNSQWLAWESHSLALSLSQENDSFLQRK